MKIDSLKELKNLLQLCRKQGVEVIKVDNIELVLREQSIENAFKRANRAKAAISQTLQDRIDTPDELSPEDLLFYSASGQVPPMAGN